MEPMKLYFDFRDIFRAPRLALSIKKILLFLQANLLGFAIYWIFSYIAFLLNGVNLSEAINQYGLYPCIYAAGEASVLSQIVYIIGVLIWILIIFFACTAVSRITYKQLKGDDFYSGGDAKLFVKKHKFPILMSNISILLIALVFILVAVVFALIGKIPFIGEILTALLYILYFFGAVFTVYTLIVFFTSVIYSPAIIASLEEDTMGTVFQSYSITWSQPWRVIVYHILLLPLTLISISVFKWFWLAGYKLFNMIFGADWLMGTKLHNIVGWSSDLVLPKLNCCSWFNCSIEVGETAHHSVLLSLQEGVALSTTEYISGTILAIFLFLLFLSIISYGLSILSVGETIMFTIFRMKSDDENILLRKDEDDDEDDNNEFETENESDKDNSENNDGKDEEEEDN